MGEHESGVDVLEDSQCSSPAANIVDHVNKLLEAPNGTDDSNSQCSQCLNPTKGDKDHDIELSQLQLEKSMKMLRVKTSESTLQAILPKSPTENGQINNVHRVKNCDVSL